MSDGKEPDPNPNPDIDSDTDDSPQAPTDSIAAVAAVAATSVTTGTEGQKESIETLVPTMEPSVWREIDPPPSYEPEQSWLCCTTYKDASKFKTILHYLELTDAQKHIIETRYLHILRSLQKRTRNHAIVFFIGHFIITVGSLFVPALLSIQNSDKEYAPIAGNFNVHMYWATFAISLLVTMWNAILTLFRIDKKYYFLNTTLERLRSEGWQYVSLTGRYSGHLTKKKPTHKNQFVYFTHYVERIKMKQIEEEYYRTDEKSQAPTAASAATVIRQTTASTARSPIDPHSFSPPLPIDSMAQSDVPREIQSSLDYLRQSQAYMSPLSPSVARSSTLSVPPVFGSYRMAPTSSPSKEMSSVSTALPSDSSVAIPISTEQEPLRSPSPLRSPLRSPLPLRTLPAREVTEPAIIASTKPIPRMTHAIRAFRPTQVQNRLPTPPPTPPIPPPHNTDSSLNSSPATHHPSPVPHHP